jgi:hypothetical protein
VYYHRAAVWRRDYQACLARHERAVAALRLAVTKLRYRKREQPPLLKASDMLAAAEVPLGELASLFGGQTPTAEQIDQAGFWHLTSSGPQWLVPIGAGWFVEMDLYVSQGADVTNAPHTVARPMSAEEIEKFVDEWQRSYGGGRAAPAPAPAPEPKGVPANDF